MNITNRRNAWAIVIVGTAIAVGSIIAWIVVKQHDSVVHSEFSATVVRMTAKSAKPMAVTPPRKQMTAEAERRLVIGSIPECRIRRPGATAKARTGRMFGRK